MRTTLDCLVCFVRQSRAAGLLATDDPSLQRRMINGAGRLLGVLDPLLSPPENAVALYGLFSEILQDDDPFAQVKEESNRFALDLRDEMAQRIAAAADPLYAAVRTAIGGNIIDYAAQHVFDAKKTMDECLEREFIIDQYPALLRELTAIPSPDILYLCDNCGEIVFDGLLIRELQQRNCRVTAAVRGRPIINDATLEDARTCGLDQICPVITNGTGCPGTPLARCSSGFLEHFHRADIIISKGMGNYETLSEEDAPIFFLFTVKCSEVAAHVTKRKQLARGSLAGKGEMIFMRQQDEELPVKPAMPAKKL